MTTWINSVSTTTEVTSSALARGAYGLPESKPITDTPAVVLAAATGTGQYISISNSGPNSALLRFGDDATGILYNVEIPPGFNDNEMRIATNENLTAICKTGETASLMVAIAPEVQI